jgi:vacuolar-type H+-ATPase subunit H
MLQQPFSVALSEEDEPLASSTKTPLGSLTFENRSFAPEPAAPDPIDPAVTAQLLVLLGEFSRLEELLLTSPKVPLTGKVMVAEEQVIEQMDFIRRATPAALATAQAILEQQQQILAAAEHQSQQIIRTAEQRAFEISNEMGIMERARAEADHLRHQMLWEAQQEQDRLRQETEQIRQQLLTDCLQIQRGADDYADAVLQSLEEQLLDIQAKISRGREHLRTSGG